MVLKVERVLSRGLLLLLKLSLYHECDRPTEWINAVWYMEITVDSWLNKCLSFNKSCLSPLCNSLAPFQHSSKPVTKLLITSSFPSKSTSQKACNQCRITTKVLTRVCWWWSVVEAKEWWRRRRIMCVNWDGVRKQRNVSIKSSINTLSKESNLGYLDYPQQLSISRWVLVRLLNECCHCHHMLYCQDCQVFQSPPSVHHLDWTS